MLKHRAFNVSTFGRNVKIVLTFIAQQN